MPEAIAAMPNPVGNLTIYSPLNFTFPVRVGFCQFRKHFRGSAGRRAQPHRKPGKFHLDNTGGTINASGARPWRQPSEPE